MGDEENEREMEIEGLWDTQRYVSMKFIQMEEYTYNVIEL